MLSIMTAVGLQVASRVIRSFEATSALALFHAAASSPTAVHRRDSCLVLLAASWAEPPSGTQVAYAALLPSLVDQVEAAEPLLGQVQDWVPFDPRPTVRWRHRIGSRELRIPVHPGLQEDPLEMLDRLARLASAVDPVIEAHSPYGILDLIELAGILLKHERTALEPHWADGTVEMPSDRPTVTQDEVQAAARHLAAWDLERLIEGNPAADRLRAALQAATAPAEEVRSAFACRYAAIGPTFAVSTPTGVHPVPSSIVLESLDAAVGRLVQAVLEKAPKTVQQEVDRRWHEECLRTFEVVCSASGGHVLPVRIRPSGRDITMLASGHRHVVFVDLVTGLSSVDLDRRVADARTFLNTLGAETEFDLPAEVTAWFDGRDSTASVPDEDPTGPTWARMLADALPFARPASPDMPAKLCDGSDVARLVVVDGIRHDSPERERGVPVVGLSELRRLLHDGIDRSEVWEFVSELATLGGGIDGEEFGFDRVHAFSILDLWACWKSRGSLAPAWGAAGTALLLPPRDIHDDWQRAVSLDDVAGLLFDLELPPLRDWQYVLEDSPSDEEDVRRFVTLTSMHPRQLVLALPRLGVVVGGPLESEHFGPDGRELLVGLLSAVSNSLARLAMERPTTWQRWRAAASHAPVLIVVLPEAVPDWAREDAGAPCIRILVIGTDRVLLGCQLARLRQFSPEVLHHLVGDALATAFGGWLSPPRSADSGDEVVQWAPPDDVREAMADFTVAWNESGPTLHAVPFARPFHPAVVALPIPLDERAMERAARSVARSLVDILTPGSHHIDLALTLCDRALALLAREATVYGTRSAQLAACGELERVRAAETEDERRREANLTGPWSSDHFTRLRDEPEQEYRRHGRAAEMLVEALLLSPPTGHLNPDRRDVARLKSLAAWAIELALERQSSFFGLQPAVCHVSEVGSITTVTTTPFVHLDRWQQARWQVTLERGTEGHALGPSDLDFDAAECTSESSFERVTDALQLAMDERGPSAQSARALVDVDAALRTERGYGFDAMTAVLNTVVSWPVPDDPVPPVAVVRRDELRDNVAEWSALWPGEVQAAIDDLTLSAARIEAEGFRYWQLERRSARLSLRPIVAPSNPRVPDELWLLPRTAQRTLRIWLNYLEDGRIPWPKPELSPEVKDSVKKWRRVAEKHLEYEIERIALDAGLRCRRGLQQHKATGVPLTREVDLLAADVSRRRLYVVEAKDLEHPFSPDDIATNVLALQGVEALDLRLTTWRPEQTKSRKPPAVRRLLENTRVVRDHIVESLALLTVDAIDPSTWEVVPLLVTKGVEVAAFVRNPRVTFLSVAVLGRFLTTCGDPEPGWWTPSG